MRSFSLVLAQDWAEPHDDGCEGALDVLVGVVDEILDAGEDVVHDDGLLHGGVQGLAEIADLVGGGGADLGLAILQQALKGREIGLLKTKATRQIIFSYLEGWDEVVLGDLRSHGLLEVGELVGDHVPEEE